MALYSSEVFFAMVVGVLVVVVALLIISVKTMTLLIHITRRKNLYICPGHTVTQKKMGQFTQEHEYDVPQESTNGRQYDTINADDVQRNNSRTDQKQIFQHQLSQQSMQEPVYHDIATRSPPSETNIITQRNSNIRKSDITVV